MKNQLYTRLSPGVVERIIRRFNDREMSVQGAMNALGVSKAQVYNLRTQWLASGKKADFLGISSGDHAKTWPEEAVKYLETLIMASKNDGPNCELYADELSQKFGFVRDHSNVRRYCEQYLMPLVRSVFPVERKTKERRRRWESTAYGEI